MKEADLCPVCKCPRSKAGSGSLTQWIVVCNCDALSSASQVADETEALLVDLCRKCGKRISQGRAGSFTQYIFRSDLCACEVPEAYRASLPVDSSGEAQALSSSTVIEEEQIKPDQNLLLELDNSSFPLERYEALRHLGRGGGGRVYLARDLLLNKLVAVKLLNSFDEKQIIAFQTEARATSKLNHQGIVRLLDFGVVGDSLPYMVLDYVPGSSLEEVLARRGRLDWSDAREIFFRICDALAYAHDQGIYHRDLKPGNILLIEDEHGTNQVKLIDFGLARIAEDFEKGEDSGGKTIVGAPLYMSPDQARGYEYDARSEIYSLGCVLFETLVGSPPFLGDSALVTLSLHSEAPIPRPCRLVPSLPAVLDEIIIRALAKNPEGRYGSVAEFREALGQIDRKVEEKDDSVLESTPGKSLLLPVSLALAVIFSLSLIGFIFYRPPDKPKQVEEIPQKEAKTLADLKYEKNESFAANIPDAMVDKELNWTGGKWKLQEISKFNLLEAEGHEVGDADFKEIAANKKVTGVKLTMESTATGTGFKYLKELDLRSVWIMSNYFNDEGAACLSAFPDITVFKITASNNMTAAGFEPIVSLPRLRTLKLRKTFNLPRGAAAVIGKSMTLKNLSLCYMSEFSLEDMEAIARIPTLQSLDLNGTTDVDDRYVPALIKLPLRNLCIGLTGVSDQGLMELAKMKELKSISVTVRYPAEVEELKAAMGKERVGIITEAGLDRFRTSRPDCQILLYKQISPLGIY